MNQRTGRLVAITTFLCCIGLPAVALSAATSAPAVDPAATQILKRMTDELAALDRFSVHTQVTIEDVTDRDHRVDMDVSARMTIDRPDRLKAERRGEPLDQVFYYDGKTLTLFNPGDGVYASEAVPATIEGMLDQARESLGLIIPAADMVYSDAYALLMQDVNYAAVVGKSVINGQSCEHLLFSRPGVDFQVWVAEGDRALPCKYVVTDTAQPGRVSISTVMSDWDLAPDVSDAVFRFEPPAGASSIPFMTTGASN